MVCALSADGESVDWSGLFDRSGLKEQAVLTHQILSAHRDPTPEARARRRIAGREAIRRRLVGPAESPHPSRREAIRHLAQAIDRDLETAGHVERVGEYSALMARALGEPADTISTASLLHDIGKVAIPDAILLKAGTLDQDERSEMQQHAEIGHWILSGTGDELLELAATISLTHHERYDGAGYPHRLSGEGIPLAGRIAAVADVFDALTSDRVYRGAFAVRTAISMMRAERGAHFDPHILDAFLDALPVVTDVRSRSRALAASAA
jgi:putative two-component system response regulator